MKTARGPYNPASLQTGDSLPSQLGITVGNSVRLALAAALVSLAGCAGLRGPDWCRPGPAAYQQRVAERFDPFAQPDVAPEVVGGRPRELQRPLAEPARARWPVPGVRSANGATPEPAPQ